MENGLMKTVMIIGAGPCGLVMAHYLLRRGQTYRVELYDNRPDPRVAPPSSARAYSIDLGLRGRAALAELGLETLVAEHGKLTLDRQVHNRQGGAVSCPRHQPRLTIDRAGLTQVLLETLTQRFDASRLQIHFEQECVAVDLEAKSATFKAASGQQQIHNYDLLIGADGVRSKVREQLQQHSPNFEVKTRISPVEMKPIGLRCLDHRPDLQPDQNSTHIYSLGNNGVLLVVPRSNGTYSGLVMFIRGRNNLAGLKSGQKVVDYFRQYLGDVSQLIPIEEAEAFAQKYFFRTTTVMCNRYHHGDSVLLVGDAAHAVSPILGQGCSSALEDALIFNQQLDWYRDNLTQAVPQFTARRHPDMMALEQISDSLIPLTITMAFSLLFKHGVDRILHRWLPKFWAPSSLDMLSESTVPYRDILQTHARWIKVFTMLNQRVADTPIRMAQPPLVLEGMR
jgi:kynurenine 3-monooxygenase